MGRTDTDLDVHPIAPVEHLDPVHRQGSRIVTWITRYWLLLVLLVGTAVVSVVVRHVVYPALSWNRDESTYLWQVSGLRVGKLLTTTGGLPQFFHPWLTGISDGEFFSQYTLGWPGLMVVGDLLFGSPAASIVWGTVLAILGSYVFTREVTRDHRLSLITAALMLACPMVITQAGVYLGYLFTLGTGLLFGAALLAGVRRTSWWLLVVSGLLLGIVFLTRPFDAVLWAVAMGGYAIFTTWREWSRQAKAVVFVFLGFLPFLLLALVHNHIVTGSFTQFPFTAKEPLDKFGFGYRRLMPHILGIDYTLGQAVRGSGVNAFYVPQFLVGSYVGVLAAVSGLWLRRRDRSTWLLLAMMVVFPAGYFMFWGNRLSSGFAYLSGPLYFIPLFVPLCIFIATALVALWQRRRVLLIGLLILMAVATAPFLYDKSSMNHRISAAQEPWQHSTDSLAGKALVIIRDSGPYVLHINPFSENAPDLDGRVLYAVDRGAGSFGLIDRYPDRTPYIQRTSNPALADAIHHPDASPPVVSLLPVTVVSGPAVTLRVQVHNPTNAATVVAMLAVGDRIEQRILEPSAAGVYETSWTLVPAGTTDPSSPASNDIIPVSGRGALTVTAGGGATAASALTGPHVRERYAFRVHDGDVQLLDPPRKTVVRPTPERIVLRDVLNLSALQVDVSS